jgi:hypothetical protein
VNKAEFAILLEKPGSLNKSHFASLRAIAGDFPWFPAVHVLQAKALFNENHYEFEKQLRHTALRVPDRERLYQFIHGEEPQLPPGVQEQITDLVRENSTSPPQERHVDTPVAQPGPVNQELITDPTPDNEAVEETVAETGVGIAEDNVPVSPLTPVEPLEEPPVSTDQMRPAIVESPVQEQHSFMEWLALQKENATRTPAPGAKEKTEPPAEIEPSALGEKEEAPPVKSNISQFESILDKFIRENPSISRPKAEFYNPVSVAKHSVEEDEELVTETLAGIYYKQGAYKKAIRAYEKLCLIYPHKMAFFADLIKKIKEESKNE